MPLAKPAANTAVDALKITRKDIEKQISLLDQELQTSEALETLKKLQAKETLVKQRNEIDSSLREIGRAQEEPVKSGGACSG